MLNSSLRKTPKLYLLQEFVSHVSGTQTYLNLIQNDDDLMCEFVSRGGKKSELETLQQAIDRVTDKFYNVAQPA